MEIRVKIEKRHAFLIAIAFALFALSIFVYAFVEGNTGTPSVMGHSVGEIDWSKIIAGSLNLGNARTHIFGFDGAGYHWFTVGDDVTGKAALAIKNDSSVVIHSNLCLTDGCKSAWGQVSGGASGLGSCKTICFNSGDPAPCDVYMNNIAAWRWGADCNELLPGYPIVSGIEEDYNGNSFFVAKVKCCALA